MASIFMAMSLGLVAMSGSRGSAISMILTLLIFLFSKPTRPWGILGLCILALGAIIAPLIFSAVLERFTVVRGDTLLGGREMYWHATWNLILDQPLKGVGLGNAPLALIPYLGSLAGVIELEKLSIHNPTLAIWSETGFPGLILYLSVLASAVWLFVRQYQKSGRPEMQWLMPYFALVSAVFLGFIASWAKGGGMETAFTYFLMLSFLLIPCVLEPKDSENSNDGQTLGIGTGRIEGGV
jgi:putative inorganic carbon (HCO3(-)) transporter